MKKLILIFLLISSFVKGQETKPDYTTWKIRDTLCYIEINYPDSTVSYHVSDDGLRNVDYKTIEIIIESDTATINRRITYYNQNGKFENLWERDQVFKKIPVITEITLQCSGIKADGNQCTRTKTVTSDIKKWYCWQHKSQE